MLEMKRCMKMMTKSVISMLVVLCISIGGIAAISTFFMKSAVIDPVKVAVVIPEDETMTKMIVQYISGMDSVSAICQFKYMDETSALTVLDKQEVEAAVVLPPNLYGDMYQGGSADVTVYVLKSGKLNTQLFKELLNDGVSMLKTAEAGVFAAQETAGMYRARMDDYEVANYIAYAYMEKALQRSQMFDTSVISPFGQMSMMDFYIAAAVTIVMVFVGLNFGFLYQRESRAVAQKLKINGIGCVQQSITKIAVMTMAVWMIQVCVYLIFAGITHLPSHAAGNGSVLNTLQSVMAYSGIVNVEPGVCVEMLISSVAVAVWFHLCYVIAGDGKRGQGLLFGLNCLMIFGAGIVVPKAYMPEIIRRIGDWLPVTLLHKTESSIMFDSLTGMQAILLIGWILMIGTVATCILAVERRGK